MTDITELQEAPTGKPWERDWIATWEPGPLDEAEYERMAEHAAAMFEFAGSFFLERPVSHDPLLSTQTSRARGRSRRQRHTWTGERNRRHR